MKTIFKLSFDILYGFNDYRVLFQFFLEKAINESLLYGYG